MMGQPVQRCSTWKLTDPRFHVIQRGNKEFGLYEGAIAGSGIERNPADAIVQRVVGLRLPGKGWRSGRLADKNACTQHGRKDCECRREAHVVHYSQLSSGTTRLLLLTGGHSRFWSGPAWGFWRNQGQPDVEKRQ